MKHYFTFFALSLLFSAGVTLSAQQTPITHANYDLAERFSPKKVNRMVFTQSIRANWFEKSDKFWYEWKNTDGVNYYIVDPVAKTKRYVFDLEQLAMQLTEITKDPFDAQHIPIKNLKLKDDKIFTFDIQSNLEVEKKDKKDKNKEAADTTKKAPKGKPKMEKKVFHFEYDIASNKLKDVSDIEPEAQFPRWAGISPDSSYVVYAKGYNLYYMDMANLRKAMEDEKDSTIVETALTTDGTKDIPYGGNSYSGIDERDSTKRYRVSTTWSPDSKYFTLEKFDLSGLKELWVINSLSNPRPTLETYKYQLPGEPSAKTYVMLFNMQDKTHKVLKADKYKDQSIEVENAPFTKKNIYSKYFCCYW